MADTLEQPDDRWSGPTYSSTGGPPALAVLEAEFHAKAVAIIDELDEIAAAEQAAAELERLRAPSPCGVEGHTMATCSQKHLAPIYCLRCADTLVISIGNTVSICFTDREKA